MKYEKHSIRVSKGQDFIMIDLLSPDGKTTTSTEVLGGIVLSKGQYKELKKFVEDNPDFAEDLKELMAFWPRSLAHNNLSISEIFSCRSEF